MVLIVWLVPFANFGHCTQERLCMIPLLAARFNETPYVCPYARGRPQGLLRSWCVQRTGRVMTQCNAKRHVYQ